MVEANKRKDEAEYIRLVAEESDAFIRFTIRKDIYTRDAWIRAREALTKYILREASCYERIESILP